MLSHCLCVWCLKEKDVSVSISHSTPPPPSQSLSLSIFLCSSFPSLFLSLRRSPSFSLPPSLSPYFSLLLLLLSLTLLSHCLTSICWCSKATGGWIKRFHALVSVVARWCPCEFLCSLEANLGCASLPLLSPFSQPSNLRDRDLSKKSISNLTAGNDRQALHLVQMSFWKACDMGTWTGFVSCWYPEHFLRSEFGEAFKKEHLDISLWQYVLIM